MAAVSFYRRALAAGLDESRREQATIQLASTLRNLGRIDESLRMLKEERERGGALSDEAAAFYALALVSAGLLAFTPAHFIHRSGDAGSAPESVPALGHGVRPRVAHDALICRRRTRPEGCVVAGRFESPNTETGA